MTDQNKRTQNVQRVTRCKQRQAAGLAVVPAVVHRAMFERAATAAGFQGVSPAAVASEILTDWAQRQLQREATQC